MLCSIRQRRCLATVASIGVIAAASRSSHAQTIDPFYASTYSVNDLGAPPGALPSFGGMAFKAGEPDTLLLGVQASGGAAKIDSIPLTRDPTTHHITGFGTATFFADAPGFNGGGLDGGLVYGPGGVLFYTTYPDNWLGQIKPGSTGPDKLSLLTARGVTPSTGSVMFVPAGFGGAGRMKINSYDGDNWYDTTVVPDGTGTYEINLASPAIFIGGGPEGTIYISHTTPLFPADSVLISEYNNDLVVAYDVNANGDPIPATRRIFMSGLSGPEGAVMDPVTGDFLFATAGANPEHIVRVQVVPEPSACLMLMTMAASVLRLRPRGARQG
ncbi:MAG TPA: hypothetical protein VH518_21465 [Tepidisphaeraceae bacterium]|jgi:hypothetical protein